MHSVTMMYREAWDCEAERQQNTPPKENEFDRMVKVEPTERELEFRHKQPYRNNLKDYR